MWRRDPATNRPRSLAGWPDTRAATSLDLRRLSSTLRMTSQRSPIGAAATGPSQIPRHPLAATSRPAARRTLHSLVRPAPRHDGPAQTMAVREARGDASSTAGALWLEGIPELTSANRPNRGDGLVVRRCFADVCQGRIRIPLHGKVAQGDDSNQAGVVDYREPADVVLAHERCCLVNGISR